MVFLEISIIFLHISGIDVLVHSAGIVVNGSTIDLPISEYDRCMNINARSAFILTKECLPHLLKTKGSIVHVSSVTGNKRRLHSLKINVLLFC